MHTRRHVLTSASESRAQRVAQAGAVGPHVCARVPACVCTVRHRPEALWRPAARPRGRRGLLSRDLSRPEPSPGGPCGEGACGGGAPTQHRPWQPRGTPEGAALGCPPQCLESGRPRAQRWAPHTQWRRRSVVTAPVEKGAPGAAAAGAWGAARRGEPPVRSRAGPRRGGATMYRAAGARPRYLTRFSTEYTEM